MARVKPSTLPVAMGALREITRSLSAAVDLNSTLNLIAQKTTEVMNVDSCTIYLLEQDGERLILRATTGLHPEILGDASLKVGRGMTGAAIARNEPIFAPIAQHHPDFMMVDDRREKGLTSLLAVPLLIQDEPIGAMNVQTQKIHHYTSSEIEVLSLIGDLAAGALAKARLYDAQKARLDELMTLAAVSEAVTSPQYLEDMLDIVTEMAAQTMNTAVCSLFLQDETGDYLQLRSTQLAKGAYESRQRLQFGEGIIGLVAQRGEAIFVPQLSAEPRFRNPTLAQKEGLVSMLAVPLSVRDRIIGVLACYTKKKRQFTDKETTLFSTLANQTALAIENAQLVTNVAIVREMHHRIKNNLQMVAMLMQLQMPDADKLDTREVLQTNIQRIRSIATVHEVLSDKGFRQVDVRDVLQRVATATVQAFNAPSLRVEIQVVGADLALPSRMATALTLVVNELVQNAVEHAFIGRNQGRITVSLGESAENIAVWVRDDGIGIPEPLTNGLGLEIAFTLVEDLGGALLFRRRSHGTEVTIRLPLPDQLESVEVV